MKTRIEHIYAYHEDLGNENFNNLVLYWHDVWAAHGWIPHILGPRDARLHPRYGQFMSKVETLPTFNNRDFERTCYERWCAFALIDKPGALTDYDVFPRVANFPPIEVETLYCGDPAGGPGFICGYPHEFEKIIDVILEYRVQPADRFLGNPHVSDMGILHRNNHVFRVIENLITCYGKDDWETLPLTHFGNAYMKKAGELSKTDEIKQVLNAQKGLNV